MKNPSLTIAQVSTSDQYGGAERIAADLHEFVNKTEHISYLAVGHQIAKNSSSILIPNDDNRSLWARFILSFQPQLKKIGTPLTKGEIIARRTIKTIAEPSRALNHFFGYDDFNFPGTKMIPSLTPNKINVLHLHNLHGGYFDLRYLPSISQKIPTVLTAHDFWLATGHCAHSLGCDRWRTGCGNCPRLDIPPAVLRDRTSQNWKKKQEIFKNSKIHLVGASDWITGRLENSIFSNAIISKQTIRNGVNIEIFKPAKKSDVRHELGLPQDSFILLFNAADITNPYKDFKTIRSAIQQIASDPSLQNIFLIAMGGSPKDQQLVDEKRIMYVPYLESQSDVAKYLQASDTCILMSNEETLGLASLEAQSCGVPVIASNVGGIPETFVPRKSGILVPKSDARELIDAIRFLATHEKELKEMSDAAYENAHKNFSIQKMTNSYLELYTSIAEHQ